MGVRSFVNLSCESKALLPYSSIFHPEATMMAAPPAGFPSTQHQGFSTIDILGHTTWSFLCIYSLDLGKVSESF